MPDDDTPEATEEEVKYIQQVVGTILYYARAVDLTLLMALSTIASEQATATKTTIKNAKQLLDYLAWHPNATIRFHASDMILNIHSDASYLSPTNEPNKNNCSMPRSAIVDRNIRIPPHPDDERMIWHAMYGVPFVPLLIENTWRNGCSIDI